MENQAEQFSNRGIHFTAMSESELSEKRGQRQEMEAYLQKALRPTAERIREEHRVNDLRYDAVQKSGRKEFSRLFQEHMIPLAHQKEAAASQSSWTTIPTALIDL